MTFEAAQAAYDSMLPPDPVIYTCKITGESSEDCLDCINDEHDGEPDDDGYDEPPDFDERRYERDDYDYFD